MTYLGTVWDAEAGWFEPRSLSEPKQHKTTLGQNRQKPDSRARFASSHLRSVTH